MGVELGELVQKDEITLEALSGRVIAVDAYNALYQFLSIIRQPDGTPLMDSKGRITSHLSGIFYRTAKLIEAGIRPAYVFDGEPPKLKRSVLEGRKEVREKAEERWKDALRRGELAEARVYAQASSKLSREMVEDAKKLVELMGLPVIQAPGEGEAQAAFLAERNVVDACSSQDYDSLLFGAPRLVRNLTMSGRRKLPRKDVYVDVRTELVELGRSLKALGIDRKGLIWIGILVGTDFNSGVKGIGPKKALKIVAESSSFEDVFGKFRGEIDADPSEVEGIFLHPAVDENCKVDFGEPNAEGVVKFLCGEHSFSEDRVRNTLKVMVKVLTEKTMQSSLGDWFGR
ncbi:MAG: Flap structure-specific endonuclease [Candidatus Fermentimicrarchaeum limneticum]|uniref:Flap endonuclease 1 n=1 Tax=Fermentimicrarchaeum limneticum TaxID=2795018 RepID=A0A7D6BL14_FERL1|nr:MAG: Flap structure-specific endonuclease [Candidatus Fermentimicrarchaeum limneticum]